MKDTMENGVFVKKITYSMDSTVASIILVMARNVKAHMSMTLVLTNTAILFVILIEV